MAFCMLDTQLAIEYNKHIPKRVDKGTQKIKSHLSKKYNRQKINMTPKTKVFYNGKPLTRKANGTYTHKNRSQRIVARLKHLYIRTIYYTKLSAILAVAALTFFTAGAIIASTHVIEAQTITPPQTIPPIMLKISTCESHNHQYAPSGQVLMKPNTNGTVDVGLYQINTVWFAKATSLHYDVTTEQGNKDMALWIYANKGTSPWYSSSKCWLN